MIRPAVASDIKPLFLMRNLKEAVALSSSRKTVSWEEHKRWFDYAIQEEDVLVYIIEPDAGNIRFNRIDEEAYISITVIKEYQGKGIGTLAINEAVRLMRQKWSVRSVVANIRQDNEQSLKAFTKCGFVADRSKPWPEGHTRMMSL